MGVCNFISSQKVIKPNYNNLLKIRKSIKKVNLMDYVLYLINIKIDENEIALIFTIHKILIYELSSLKKVYENDINYNYFYYTDVNRIQKLKSNILIFMANSFTKTLIIKKDKNLNKYHIYKGKIFDYSLSSINLVELSNNNLVLLKNYSIYLFKSNEEKEIEFKEILNEERIIKQKLPLIMI